MASGKTVVSDVFKRQGVKIVDTDLIARQVVSLGSEGLIRLEHTFGKGVLDEGGALNRAFLREKVFADNASRMKLNAVMHPLIHQEVVCQISQSSADMIVVVIPLYAGQAEYLFFDRVCVVDVSESSQISRLQKRDGVDLLLANSMVASQINRKTRLKLADDVICNRKSLTDIMGGAMEMLDFYQNMRDCSIQSCQ